MNEEESKGTGASGETAVLPETAAQLVELERLQRALAEAEERGRNHWEQYLRAVADLDNVRKRAHRDVEAANRYGLEKFVSELLPVRTAWIWRCRMPATRTRRACGPGCRRR